jgi:DtxR family transcriptional regulator, Mn-dependent transcriptional regulator
MEISFTEENYLKAIWSISQGGKGAGASTNEISELLDNKAGTVTDMLKRLAEKKLINYQKYKGVLLTPKGQRLAVSIVRKHRLWEVFLMEKLSFGWDEVHDIAEQLEHIRSDELINRLDAFLGKPRFDPHGDPIPGEDGQITVIKAVPLGTVRRPGAYVFTGVVEHSKAFLQHLTSIGLKIGDSIRVEQINEFDRSLSVTLCKHKSQFLSEKVSMNILVEARK